MRQADPPSDGGNVPGHKKEIGSSAGIGAGAWDGAWDGDGEKLADSRRTCPDGNPGSTRGLKLVQGHTPIFASLRRVRMWASSSAATRNDGNTHECLPCLRRILLHILVLHFSPRCLTPRSLAWPQRAKPSIYLSLLHLHRDFLYNTPAVPFPSLPCSSDSRISLVSSSISPSPSSLGPPAHLAFVIYSPIWQRARHF